MVELQTYYDDLSERLQSYTITVNSINDTKTGTFGILLHLDRYSKPLIFKYYVPCFGLSILTTLSFFIPPKLVPGRGGMLVTLCLVLTNIFNNSKVISSDFPKKYKIVFTEKSPFLQNETPDSKVLTALTIYILGCLVFSFLAMMYYGVILSLIRKPQKIKDSDGSKITNAKNDNSEDAFVVTDKLFFVLYTILFLLFNIVYFTKYMDKMF